MALTYRRPKGINGHLGIRDFTLTSCHKGAYLYINSPILIINNNQPHPQDYLDIMHFHYMTYMATL